MKRVLGLLAVAILVATAIAAKVETGSRISGDRFDHQIQANTALMLLHGKQTFRYDTFGDEDFWVAP